MGGYHHHFGLNTWQSDRRLPAPQGSIGLVRVNVNLPEVQDLDSLEGRLRTADVPFTREDTGLDVRDPAGNALRFSVERA